MARRGVLYLVAMPIGNPDDLSPRALATLGAVEVIAAEDTRVAGPLLARHGVRKRLLSFHEHNEESRGAALLERLAAGDDVAVVSDAGTPLVSDPGYRLVAAAAERGFRVVPVPGPCAAIAALVASGLPTDRFVYAGFLPRRGSKRRSALEELRRVAATLVIYEAPHRIVDTLADCAEVLGDRRAALARNLTKEHESFLRGRLSEVRAALLAEPRVAGEMTLVVEGAAAGADEEWPEAAERAVAALLGAGLTPRRVRDLVAEIFGLGRRDVYRRILDAAPGDSPSAAGGRLDSD